MNGTQEMKPARIPLVKRPDFNKKILVEECKEIRKFSRVPIIMLTARDQEIDKVLALELGADDYVTKPFALHEFLARVKARLRRQSSIAPGHDDAIVLGEIVLDPSRQQLTVRGKEVALAPKE